MKAPATPFLIRPRIRWDDVDNADEYPFVLPAVRGLDRIEFHPAVTYFVGENGSGKSTLIEAFATACGFNPEGGDKHTRFATARTESPLSDVLTIVRSARREKDGFFMRAESMFNLATYFEGIGGSARYGDRTKLHHQSHGEFFLAIANHRFESDSLFFLDEPESALSPARQLSLLILIHRLVQSRCQFVISTHSPLLMAYPNARMYELGPNGPTETDWQETEHYRVTRDFLNQPEAFVRRLLEQA